MMIGWDLHTCVNGKIVVKEGWVGHRSQADAGESYELGGLIKYLKFLDASAGLFHRQSRDARIALDGCVDSTK